MVVALYPAPEWDFQAVVAINKHAKRAMEALMDRVSGEADLCRQMLGLFRRAGELEPAFAARVELNEATVEEAIAVLKRHGSKPGVSEEVLDMAFEVRPDGSIGGYPLIPDLAGAPRSGPRRERRKTVFDTDIDERIAEQRAEVKRLEAERDRLQGKAEEERIREPLRQEFREVAGYAEQRGHSWPGRSGRHFSAPTRPAKRMRWSSTWLSCSPRRRLALAPAASTGR